MSSLEAESELFLLLSLLHFSEKHSNVGVFLRERLTISLSTPPLTPSIMPQGTRGIFRAPPPSLPPSPHQLKKTCRHWKHLSILMRQFYEDLWWLDALPSLGGEPFHPLWIMLPLFHVFIRILQMKQIVSLFLFLSFVSFCLSYPPDFFQRRIPSSLLW